MDNELLKIREQDLFWRQIEDELVALDGRSWEYLSLNGSGAKLWEKLRSGATRHELRSTLVDEYGIKPEVADRDVDAFVTLLRERGLLDGEGQHPSV